MRLDGLLWLALPLVAVGLWLMRRWGEYFAVIATSVFLPLEIYELTEKLTATRLIALIINIVAVVWLLWSKRLFGLNGGGKAHRDPGQRGRRQRECMRDAANDLGVVGIKSDLVRQRLEQRQLLIERVAQPLT